MMHELVSSVLGSSSDDVMGPLLLKPLTQTTLELVYSQLLTSNASKRRKIEAQNLKSEESSDLNQKIQVIGKAFAQNASRKMATLSSNISKTNHAEVNDFWMLSALSGPSVTNSMIAASSSILLNSPSVINSRNRIGVLNCIWKALKSSSGQNNSKYISKYDLSAASSKEPSDSRVEDQLSANNAPSFGDICSQTGFSIAVSFLKGCWRSTPANMDLCSDVLSNCADALSNLQPGSLHGSTMSPGVCSTLLKAREFLTNVARNNLTGVECVPEVDRQLAVCILFSFAIAEGSLNSLLEVVALFIDLSSSCEYCLKVAPIKSGLLKVANQILPNYLNLSSPAAELIRKSEIFENSNGDGTFSLQAAPMLLLASINCLVQPLLSSSPRDSSLQHHVICKPQILGWGISELISYGSQIINLPSGLLGGANSDDIIDISTSQYFLVVLLREGKVCQLPICDLSPEVAATVISSSNGDPTCIYANRCIISVAACPASTNCLALSSEGQVFYWDAVPTEREPPKVHLISLPEIFITKIAVGLQYQAALSSDGIIYIWGKNQHGQLGTGTQQEENLPVSISPRGGAKWVDISLSASTVGYTAAVNEMGEVYTWGGGSYWRLGHGASVTPMKVLSLADMASVYAGDNFTAAVTKTGKLVVWGRVFADNQMPHEVELPNSDDAVKSLAQNSNRLLVVTKQGRILLYGRDFSRTDSSGTSFLDDPNKPRCLSHLECSLSDDFIHVKVACTSIAGFVLISPRKKLAPKIRNGNQSNTLSLTNCFQQSFEKAADFSCSIDLLLNLLTQGISKRNGDLCSFVIDIFRAHSNIATTGRVVLKTDQKTKLQTCIFQLSSAEFSDGTYEQQTLSKSIELLVKECWPMLYSSPEDRLAMLLQLVRNSGTGLSRVLFDNLVHIVVNNGDLGKYTCALINSEAVAASLEIESFLTGDSEISSSYNKRAKSYDNDKDAKRKSCFVEDSPNDLILLLTTIVMNNGRKVREIANDLIERGLALEDYFSVVEQFRGFSVNYGSESSLLVSHFIRHLFSHISSCSCTGSAEGCPATSMCRGIALARDFVEFFCEMCLETTELVLKLGKVSPTYMLYSCLHLFNASLIPSCLPELVDSFLATLVFSKHHFMGSDNGRPLGLFLGGLLQPLLLKLIEMDGAFAHFEQWLDAYVMSWHSALPSRTLHQRFALATILTTMRQNSTIIHGCVLDISDVTAKDLQFLGKDIIPTALKGRETTQIFMNADVPQRELHQKIRCFITRFGIGRVHEEMDGDSSPLSFAEGPHVPFFREMVQSTLFAISLFAVEVLSQEPISQFPEELNDLVQSGVLRSSMVSDFELSNTQTIGDFVSSLSGQRPNAIYAEVVEKLLSMFDIYLANANLQAVKAVANENVALRAVKRYSLAVFIRHMDAVEPLYMYLCRSGDGSDVHSKLPIVIDIFRSVAAILQHIVKQFQQQNAVVDHSSICSPIFFALRFLLNSVDQSFDFSAEICQRAKQLRRRALWHRVFNFVAKHRDSDADVSFVAADGKSVSKWDSVILFLRDTISRNLYKTWRFGLSDDRRPVACSKLTRFIQFAKISQITELKLRFRMHMESAVSHVETTKMLTEVFRSFSFPKFEQLGTPDLRLVPHLLEAFISGLSFVALNGFHQSATKIASTKHSVVLSRKSENHLISCLEAFAYMMVDALGQVSTQFPSNLQLALLCPIVLHFSSKFQNSGTTEKVCLQGFLARLIRVLSNSIDHYGGERLKTIPYPKCLVFERKMKDKSSKYTLDMHDEDIGPDTVQRLSVGTEVVRGPHWCWGDQDVGDGVRAVGIVLRPVTADGWVRVRWANGITNNYRMGRDGRYDLRLAQDDQSAADNIGSANEFDEDDDQEHYAFSNRNNASKSDQADDDEEFHSIESGAESVFDGFLGDSGRSLPNFGGTLSSAKRQYLPLINLLTSSGQKCLQNFLLTSQTVHDVDANRFLDFLLCLYEQFWSLKQHELADGEPTMTSLTLSGADICFRDIYGFSLLHELVASPVFASLLIRNTNWMNLFVKILKQIEPSSGRAHPHFFIAIHVMVIVKGLFSLRLDSSEKSLIDSIWSLWSTISAYLLTAFTSTIPEPSQTNDKVPKSATYAESLSLHCVDCLRRIYENCYAIQSHINDRIRNALSSYSIILDLVLKSSKVGTEQDFSEILPLIAFMGAENEGRPYCGAEITSPVYGHIQLIQSKSMALVLTKSLGGTQHVSVPLANITLRPIAPFKLMYLEDHTLAESINHLILKHISLIDYLDRILLLGGLDSTLLTNTKKSMLFMAAKLFMQFVSSIPAPKASFANTSDLAKIINAASKNTSVRPKYTPIAIQQALTPLIEHYRMVSSSNSSSTASLSQHANTAVAADIEEVEGDATLQQFQVDSTNLQNSVDLYECATEGYEALGGVANIDDSDGVEDESHSVKLDGGENLSTSDDDNDTVTTIECGELVAGAAGRSLTAWDDEHLPGMGVASVGEDDSDVKRLIEMGFTRSHVYEAYASLISDSEARAPSLDTVVNWLIENPPLITEEESAPVSGNLRHRPRESRTNRQLMRRSLGRFLSSALVSDDGEEFALNLLGATTSSSTSNEEADDNAVSSSEDHRGTLSERFRPPLAAFGRAVRREQLSQSPTVAAAETPSEITANSEVCVGQIVKSLTRVDKVVFGETGYVLRVANEPATGRAGLPSFSQFRPLNRLIGSSNSEDTRESRAEGGQHSAKNVLVHWRLCGLRLWISSTDLQPIAWPWETRRDIQIGDSVKVRESVTVPRYKWGSVTHGSIGTVVALLDDLVYVNFQAQNRWAGLRKELEIIPSEAMVVCFECDGDINISSDTIYYRCRKCRPPELFVVCASCRRRLSNNSHIHGLFAFVKTRGSIFAREERGGTSTFRSNSFTASASAPNPCNTWSACVSHVLSSSNVTMLKQNCQPGAPITWSSQPGVNPPHWIQLYIKPGVLLQSICVELDSRHPQSLPNVLVLRIGQSSARLRTVRTFPVAPDLVVVELLPKPLHKYYACVEVRIPGTRGGIDAPCRIANLMVSPRMMSPQRRTSSGQVAGIDEDASSDSKKSLTLADEDEILVMTSSSDSEDGGEESIPQAIIRRNMTSSSSNAVNSSESNPLVQNAPPTIVFGWGLNDKEQLARHGPVKVKHPFVDDPLPFSGVGVIALAFGSKCSFFLTHSGHVYACGDASNGRLGLGEVPDTVATPRELHGELSFAFITKIAVHSGGRHAMALSADGRVYSWGDGEGGKLGHGDEATLLEPKLIRHLADQSIVVTAVATGSSHSACITDRGELYTWGSGEFGRLGHGDCNNYSVPKLVEFFKDRVVVQVSCGSRDAQTLVLTSDELVWSWGDGDFGKLGRGGNESCSSPAEIEDLSRLGVCQIECGAQFSLVRTNDGKVYTFGKGDYYRLGHGTESHCRRPQRVVGGGLSEEKVIDVAVGALHCLAICASGRVYTWGDGDHFQQGNSNASANRIPQLLKGIPEGYKVVGAACGSSHTGIICLPPGDKQRSFASFANPAASTPNLRLRSLSTDVVGVKPAPLPFAIPVDPLGQSVIGLIPSSNMAMDQASPPSSSSSASNWETKQSLAYRILCRNNDEGNGHKAKSNCSTRSSAVYALHLLRSHIIYKLRSIVADVSEKPDSKAQFELFLKMSPLQDNSVLLNSLSRLLKLSIAGRMTFERGEIPKQAQPLISTLKSVLKGCDSKHLLDTYLPELTEIACITNISAKTSPLDSLPPIVQESPHPYVEKSSLSGSVTIPGASSLRIIFDSQCSTEKRRDALSICDYAGRIISLKSGRDFATDWATPEDIMVEGDFISWTFTSEAGSPAGWGFRFYVMCTSNSRILQLQSYSDRKICSLPSLEVISSIMPTASKILNETEEETECSSPVSPVEEHVDRLSLFLNSLADISKNGFIAPSYRNWAVSLCAEICIAHKTDMFIERSLAALANLLSIQYDFEEAVVRPGRHLVFSVFCRKLIALALALRFDRICPAFEQASWFQRLVQFNVIAKSLLDRHAWPDQFTAAIQFRVASSSPSAPKDRDKDTSSVADEFLDNAKFTSLQDEQLVAWYNSSPDEWTLSEAAGWRVFAFGHNHRGQLSLADGPKVKSPSSVPLIEQLEPNQIVGGEQSTFVVTREGRVYAFGYGAGGRLGVGGADSVAVPTLLRALSEVQIVEVSVSSGGKHCLARSIEGQVWSWGDNADGALGHGNRLVCDQPKQIEFFRGQSVTKVAAGSAHSAAITADGQLFTWGRGRYGRLGHGDSDDQLIPLAVQSLRDHIVIDVACGSGDAQTLALTADGTVWSFGDGDYGKLGRGGSDGCRVPMIIPTLSDKDVIQVACGSQFSACLTRQGAIYTWGKGEYFRLGQGTTDHVRTPRRVAGLLGKRVVKMAIGSLHCLVLTTDGEVYAFGDNDEGQLGDGSTQPAPRPRLISVLRNRPITHIAAGSAHSFAWTVPSLSLSNSATKPVIRYPSGQLPVDCQSLEGTDRMVLRNRLLIFELFSEHFWQSVPLLRFKELPDDFPSTGLFTPLSASKLAPYLLLPHKEATLRRVVSLTTTRDRQHGPVVSIDRVSRRSGTGQSVFDQLATCLPTLLSENSLFLANRCWKVRFVAESVDDCGGGFSDSIADACEELQAGLDGVTFALGGINTLCASEDRGLPLAMGGEQLPQHHPVVLRPNGKPESLRFLGVLMGIAIRTGSPLSLSMVPAMWRLLTSAPNIGLSLNDLRELDPALLTSLREIAQMPDDLLVASELPLAVPDISGNLVPLLNGSHEYINPQNRDQFLNAAYAFRQHEFDDALKWVADGIGRVVPMPLLRLFTPGQLEWLVCGSPEVAVDVLRSITSYRGGLDANSPLVRWFWDVVEDLRPSERAQLLRFVWGRSRLPRRMSDFRGRDFVIQPLDKFGEPPAADAYLPEASTCFFMLKLPRYSCRDILEARLRYAISACQSIDLDDYVSATGGGPAMTVTEVLLNNPHHF